MIKLIVKILLCLSLVEDTDQKKDYSIYTQCKIMLSPNKSIIEKFLPPTQYVNESTVKTFIVLHHTAGGSADSTLAYWIGNKERIATHFIIDRDGDIIQCLPLDKWAYHLNVGRYNNIIPREFKRLGSLYDKRSIGIELCSLGQIVLRNGIFYDVYNRAVHSSKVIKIPKYKGYEYWEQYTDSQIESLQILLIYLLDLYPNIKNKLINQVDFPSICYISQQALEMRSAIVGHSSLVTAKYDVTNQPNLINMLNGLYSKI